MTETIRGIVININAYGAAVRLESGELASAPAADVEAHRALYERAVTGRKRLMFQVHEAGRRPVVTLAPQIVDEELEEQIASFFANTEEWETQDGVPAHERHFLKKKRRAAIFESKHQA